MIQREAINPTTLADPVGHFDRAVRVGNILYISGTSALTHVSGHLRDRKLPSSIEEQTRLTYENIKGVLEAAGGKMENIFRLVIFYVRASDWEVVDRVTREVLPDRGFVRTGFLTTLLNKDMLLEIEATALLD